MFSLPAGTTPSFGSRGRRRKGLWLVVQVRCGPGQLLWSPGLSQCPLLQGWVCMQCIHRGAQQPAAPPDPLGSFLAQSFPTNSSPWHPWGHIFNNCDQHDPRATFLLSSKARPAASHQDLLSGLLVGAGEGGREFLRSSKPSGYSMYLLFLP